jgi:hypothetical protein
MDSIDSNHIANNTHDTESEDIHHSRDTEDIHHTHIGTSNYTDHESGCGAPIKSTPKDTTTYQLM